MLSRMNEGAIHHRHPTPRRPLILIAIAALLAATAVAGVAVYLHSRGQAAPTGVVGQQLRAESGAGAVLEVTVSDVRPAPADPTALVGHVRMQLVGGADVYPLARLPLVFVDSGGVRVPLSVNPVGDLPYGLTINGAAAPLGAPNLRAGDTADADLSYDDVDTRRLHGGRLVLLNAAGKEAAVWQVP